MPVLDKFFEIYALHSDFDASRCRNYEFSYGIMSWRDTAPSMDSP